MLSAKASLRQFYVSPGASHRQILDGLCAEGLVARRWWFAALGRWRGDSSRIQAGLHQFSAAATPAELWDELTSTGQGASVSLTVPEGWNLWQLSDALNARGLAAPDGLLSLAREESFVLADPRLLDLLPMDDLRRLRRLHPEYGLLEGLFFPDTWSLEPGRPISLFARRAVDRFFAVWEPLRGAYPGLPLVAGRPLGAYEALILASLVEREARVEAERPMIAAVFLNRLALGMRLQTDPTLVYHPATYRDRPAPRHRRDKTNPYNTYAVDALPPTPIASPGRASMLAVHRPAATDALYFVARPDGSGLHVFAKTYEEHQKNVGRYRRR